MIDHLSSGRERFALQVATLFGAGRMAKAPGTWGTLATVPLAWLAQQAGFWWQLAALLLATVLGIWATEIACRHYQRKDPQQVVVDEAAGLLLTMLAAPEGWLGWLLGVTLFRLFDIVKPWPVNWLDRQLPSPWGVMADDLAAGLYAGLCITVIARITLP
ncbi:MAG: phosphatidylglycerophosphatase A [Magnetococcales bacterium]|nr:phosphatidylglycerophosphatase A [Magnetococcales bacterium]